MTEAIKEYLISKNINVILLEHTDILKYLTDLLKKSLSTDNITSDIINDFLKDIILVDKDGNVNINLPTKKMSNGLTFKTEQSYFASGDRIIKSVASKQIVESYQTNNNHEPNYTVEYMKKDFSYDLYQIEWLEKTSFKKVDFLNLVQAMNMIETKESLISDRIYPNFASIMRNNDLATATIMIKINKRLPYVLYTQLDKNSIEELNLPFSLYNLVERLRFANTALVVNSLFKKDNLSDTPLSTETDDIRKLYLSIDKVENNLSRTRLKELFNERYEQTPGFQKKIGENGYSFLSLIGFLAWSATIMLSVAGIVYALMM